MLVASRKKGFDLSNSTRALEQAVSVDGWIGTFDERGVATVHTDIVFRQGAFGDDPKDLVRFKIALKKAEIILRVPGHEPLRVIKSSITRTTSATIGKKKTTINTKTGIAGKIAAKLGLTPKVEGDGTATFSREGETDFEITEDVARFVEQHFTTPDGHAGWELRSNRDVDKYLDGAPWDPIERPRLSVKKDADRNADGDKPTMMIEVRCAREDIEILDLEEKDSERQAIFRNKKNRSANLAAAEQIIKNELERIGFMEIADISEKHSRILIADKIISEETDV